MRFMRRLVPVEDAVGLEFPLRFPAKRVEEAVQWAPQAAVLKPVRNG
jgi:hypothetical protein